MFYFLFTIFTHELKLKNMTTTAKRGRKEAKDKKIQLSFYLRKSTIKKLGGMVNAREKGIEILEKEAENIS